MQDIMIRIETDDFDAWKAQHYLHAETRAMQWFKTDTFKNASQLAKVTGRAFYLAQPQS
jgi:hypothetical protein